MGASYEFILANNRGVRLCILDQMIEAKIVRTVNNVGVLTFVIPDVYPQDYWQRDARVYVYRSAIGLPPQLFEQTFYLLRETTIIQGDNGQYLRECTCYDLNWLLKLRIVNYVARDPKALITDYADDMLRDIVRQNLGASASGFRNITNVMPSFFSVQPDYSNAPIIQKAFSFRDMFQVLTDIVNESAKNEVYLAFDVVALTENNVEFRVYRDMRGVDRRLGTVSPLILSPSFGNFANGKLLFDWGDEKTVIIAGGQGEKNDRLLVTVTDSERVTLSPFNYIESFRNATHAQKTVEVTAEAKAALRKLRPKVLLSGELVQTRGTIYGRDFGWGDYVSIGFKDMSFVARLDTISIDLNRTEGGNEEKVQVNLKAETDPALILLPQPEGGIG